MNISTIEQGEELLKRATPGPWEDPYGSMWGDPGKVCSSGLFSREAMTGGRTGEIGNMCSMTDAALVRFLVNHASELLQCAREVEGLKSRIEVLENPLPTQEEEREFYHRAYHVCHTGCPMPCPNRT